MIIKNVKVYTEDKEFCEGKIVIENGKFSSVFPGEERTDDEIVDGEGCYAIPGLIDLHFHGCDGYDICDGTKEALEKIARYEASIGVTGICPATMTLPQQELMHILSVAASYKEAADQERGAAADLLGINMEGPFISVEKKGAQDQSHIVPCDQELCQQFLDASKGLVKFVGVAPE